MFQKMNSGSTGSMTFDCHWKSMETKN